MRENPALSTMDVHEVAVGDVQGPVAAESDDEYEYDCGCTPHITCPCGFSVTGVTDETIAHAVYRSHADVCPANPPNPLVRPHWLDSLVSWPTFGIVVAVCYTVLAATGKLPAGW